MHRWIFIVAFFVLAAARCASPPSEPAFDLPPGPGRDAFVTARCWECHAPGGSAVDLREDGALVSDGWHRALVREPAWVFGNQTTHPRVPEAAVPYLAALRDARARREPVVALPPRPARDPMRGAVLYTMHCASCHGADGRGDGPAADVLGGECLPRDFTRGLYRTRSTDTLPTDADLFATITRGMFGTAMAPHSKLSGDDRWHLVDHVKSFAVAGYGERFNPFERWPREEVEIGEPLPRTADRIDYGRRLTMQVDCRVCHGEDFRGKTREAFGWVDEAGRPLPRSADLVHGVFKSGSTPRDLYRSIFLGRGGSPMPAYGPLFHSEEKRWAIVWFVKSLAKEP